MGFSYIVVVMVLPTIVKVMSMKSMDMLQSSKIQVRQLLLTDCLKAVHLASSSAVLWCSWYPAAKAIIDEPFVER